jgi:hypothetical protein
METQKCTCCAEQKSLVLRPDFGTKNNIALIALCLFSQPTAVYLWNSEEKKYEFKGNLKYQNNLILTEGDQPYELTETDQSEASSVPSVIELQTQERQNEVQILPDDAGDSNPETNHVDLEQDNFY